MTCTFCGSPLHTVENCFWNKAKLFLKRSVCWFRIRSMETELNDKLICLEMVKDSLARHSMIYTIEILQAKLANERSIYTSLFPPGVRFIWEAA